jgi:hypothetical protein
MWVISWNLHYWGLTFNNGITGAFTIDKGEVLKTPLILLLPLDAHAVVMQEPSTPMEIEIGGLTFTPEPTCSDSAINLALRLLEY